jgi:protein-tyrosine phosphatase
MKKNKAPIKIMFVCLGNICRSPLAHAVMLHKVKKMQKEKEFIIDSSGISNWHVDELPDLRMRETAEKHGIPIIHRAKTIEPFELDYFDEILVMDKVVLKNLTDRAKTDSQLSKIKLFRDYDPQAKKGEDVPDPYYGNAKGFDNVYEIIDRTTSALLKAKLK